MSAAETPSFTAAFIKRAPSMCTCMPFAWATSDTACNPSTVQQAPPPLLAVCSTSTNVCGGA